MLTGSGLPSRLVADLALGADELILANLVGVHQIAERLGFPRNHGVHGWMRNERGPFPSPVARVAGVYIWYWPDIDAWTRPRNPDRPEAWHDKQCENEDGTAPMPLRSKTSASLIEDINAGKARTE